MVVHGVIRTRDATLLLQGTLFLVLGVAVSYLGYASSTALFNMDEVIGPALFWYAVVMLLLAFPLRDAAKVCYRGLRTRLGAAVFWPFLAIHLFIYGFLLEVILASVYGVVFALSPSLTVATEVFMPPSALNALFDLSFNPSISFTLPPVLSGALSFYGFAVAILVGVLVLANVTKTVELGRLCTLGRKARSYFLVPALGLVLGASCCVSVPALVSYAFPSVGAAPSFNWVYNASYFFFPAFAVVILHLNATSIDRISANLRAGSG